MMETHVVIMAGGIGSRFWPMSTPQLPKQFVDVLGVGKTLIQLTVDRFETVCPQENFWVVTGQCYKGLVKNQIPQILDDHIIRAGRQRHSTLYRLCLLEDSAEAPRGKHSVYSSRCPGH